MTAQVIYAQFSVSQIDDVPFIERDQFLIEMIQLVVLQFMDPEIYRIELCVTADMVPVRVRIQKYQCIAVSLMNRVKRWKPRCWS